MSYSVSILLSFFFAYSFIGWVHEIVYRLITQRHFYTTGFLTLPILPIYGIGSTLILFLVSPYVTNPFLIFLFGVIISTVLEYTGHFLIDKIFHIKLWDYSHKPLNIHGRVCLENSLGFGALTLLLVYVLHPLIGMGIMNIPQQALITSTSVLSVLLVLDFVNSAVSLLRVRMQKIKGTLKDVQLYIQNEIKQFNRAKRSYSLIVSTKGILLKLHRVNVRRIAHAYPHARRR